MKRDVLIRRHGQVAEHQEARVEPCLFDPAERRVVQPPRQVKADDLGAEAGGDRTDRHARRLLERTTLVAIASGCIEALGPERVAPAKPGMCI